MRIVFLMLISVIAFLASFLGGSILFTHEARAQCRYENHYGSLYNCCVVAANCCPSCGTAANVRNCTKEAGAGGPGAFSYTEPCLTTSHPSCACGPAESCSPTVWTPGDNQCNVGTCGPCQRRTGINRSTPNQLWACSDVCVPDATCPGCCTASTPAAVNLNTPADNFVSSSNSVAISYSTTSNWATGCPQSNTYRILLSQNCTGSYTQVATLGAGTLSYNFTGLNYGAEYCWRVRTHNGSLFADSAVRRFRVNTPPSLVNLTRITPTNMPNNDVCGNLVSGVFTTSNYDPATPNNQKTSNPVRFEITYTDPESDPFAEIYFSFIPSSGPVNAFANNVLEPFDTYAPKVINSRAVLVRLNVATSTYQILNSFTGSTLNWSSPSATGNLSNSQGSATILNIGSGTSFSIAANQITARFEIRFDESGPTPFPTANLNIYAMTGSQVGAAIVYSDQSGSTRNIRRVGTWRTDLIAPISSISNALYSSDSEFSLTWNSGDNIAVSEVRTYISSTQSGASVFDATISQIINAIQGQPTYADAPNALVTISGSTSRNYQLSNPETILNFSQFVRDSACNITFSAQGAEPPIPWVSVVNGGVYSFANITNRLPSSNSVFNPILNTNIEPFLTDNLLLTQALSINPRLSRYNLSSSNYLNSSISRIYSNSAVYGDLLSNLRGADIGKLNFANLTINGSMTAQFASASTKLLVEVSGDIFVSQGSICDKNIAFYAGGNIIIDPDLAGSPDNRCIFLTAGNIQVLQGTQKTDVPLSGTDNSSYDEINALLFANNSIILNNDPYLPTHKWDGLRINGNLVTRNLINNRNLNLNTNLFQPSVAVDFPVDYIQIWTPEIASTKYSIREIRRIP